MASFGSFQIEREVYSGSTYTVYSARRSDDPQTEYALKVFAIHRGDFDVETAAQLNPLITDLERACEQRIAVQQQAAAASEFVTPVLETGHDEGGVWYATRFYPRSVNRLITGKVALSPDALEHIICCVVQGALAIKQTCGRSHGEILPTNVQISKSEKLTEAEVVLSDPLPGGAAEAELYEKSDLKAIGQLIYQLVHKKTVDFKWVMYPLDHTPEWDQMFGKKAVRWLERCNRLLDPDLTLSQINLDVLAREIPPPRKKTKKKAASQPSERAERPPFVMPKWAYKAAAGAAGLALLGIGIWLLSSAILKSGKQRTEQRFQAAMSEASDALASTNLLVAREKVALALSLKPGNQQAQELQRKISDTAESEYQKAISAIKVAWEAKQYADVTNLAVLALRFKGDGNEAKDWLEKARTAIAQQATTEVLAKDCSKAKGDARQGEGNKPWPEVLTLWQNAKTRCPSETEILEGVAFAEAMTKALGNLKDAQSKASGRMADAQQATNLWRLISADLPTQTLWSGKQARAEAVAALKADLTQLWSNASSRIMSLAKNQKCEDARELARIEETNGAWSAAEVKWRNAAELCGSDPEVRDGLDFAKAITNVLGQLRDLELKTGPTMSLSDAQQATNLFTKTMAALPGRQLWADKPSRSNAVSRLEVDLVKKSNDVTGRMALLAQGQKCDQAKGLARNAEASEAWSRVLALWQNVTNGPKGCNDQEVQQGITFASAMTSAMDGITEAKSKAIATTNDAQAVLESCDRIARLVPSPDIWSRNTARSNAVNRLNSDLAFIRRNANNQVMDLTKKEKCDTAKELALQAEGTNGWSQAASFWQTAKGFCTENDPEIAAGISFLTNMTAARTGLDRFNRIATNSLGEAQQAVTWSLATRASLADQARLCSSVTNRVTALKALSSEVDKLINAGDEFLILGYRNQCNYNTALSYCERRKDWENRIRLEKGTYDTAKANFDDGHYGFLRDLKPEDLKNLPPCLNDLLSSARQQNSIFEDLVAARATNNWSYVIGVINAPTSGSWSGKPGFSEMRQWATNESGKLVKTYDAELVDLADKFRVRGNDVEKLRPAATKPGAPRTDLSEADRAFFLGRIDVLRASYGALLQQENRAKLLGQIKDKIVNW